MPIKNSQQRKMTRIPILITAKRALGITKMYVAIAVFFSILAITVWGPGLYSASVNQTNSTTLNSTSTNSITQNAIVGVGGSLKSGASAIAFLAVPLDMVPALMLVTPVILLFVYDKNNGMLEYLLSLGIKQSDIYMQYLKTALLLTFVFLIIFIPIDIAHLYLSQGMQAVATLTPVILLTIPLALAVVSFMIICMMAFSTLQKTRAGGNQPLGLIIGWLATAPAYLTPFVFSFGEAIYVDIGISIAIAIVAFALLLSAGKLIRREKLLP